MYKFKVGDRIVATTNIPNLIKIGKVYIVYELIFGQPVCKWETQTPGYIEEHKFKLANKVEIKSKTVLI